MTRDDGGRLVREAWVKYVLETVDDPKPSHVVPWGDMLSEWDKEADRRIYEAVLDHHRLIENIGLASAEIADRWEEIWGSGFHGRASEDMISDIIEKHVAGVAK